jgi:hypothetical protein
MMALTYHYQEAGNMVRETLCHSKIVDFVRFGYNKDSYKDSINFYQSEDGQSRAEGMNFYSSYLFSLDERASIAEVKELLAFLGRRRKSPLEHYLARELLKDQDRIWDLLGIKYLRVNDLANARLAFAKVSQTFWLSDKESYKTCLNANPFYTNFNQEHTVGKADMVRFTKLTLVDSLQKVLRRANDPATPDRAKWYFLAANCYFNLTYYGNSWIMTRYWSCYNEIHPYGNEIGILPKLYPDNTAYYECERATALYLKAFQFAKNEEAKALCLGMAGRCERYKLDFRQNMGLPAATANWYQQQLKRQYPAFYPKIVVQCGDLDAMYHSL